jgi:hypothetical protein
MAASKVYEIGTCRCNLGEPRPPCYAAKDGDTQCPLIDCAGCSEPTPVCALGFDKLCDPCQKVAIENHRKREEEKIARRSAKLRADRIADLTIKLATSPFGASMTSMTIVRHNAECNAERLYVFAEAIINELDRHRKSIT